MQLILLQSTQQSIVGNISEQRHKALWVMEVNCMQVEPRRVGSQTTSCQSGMLIRILGHAHYGGSQLSLSVLSWDFLVQTSGFSVMEMLRMFCSVLWKSE